MRRIFVATFIVTAAYVRADIDDQIEFRGIRWGDKSSKHEVAGEYDGRRMAAVRRDEKAEFFGLGLTFMGRRAPGFIYAFDKEYGFYSAIAAIAAGVTDDSIARATDEISKTFGQKPVIRPVEGNRIIKWEGKKIRLQITVSERSTTFGGTISITNLPLDAKIESEIAKQ